MYVYVSTFCIIRFCVSIIIPGTCTIIKIPVVYPLAGLPGFCILEILQVVRVLYNI